MPQEDNNVPDKDGAPDDAARSDTSGPLDMVRRGLYARQEPADFKKRQQLLHRLGLTRRPQGDLEQKEDTLAVTKYRNLAWQRAKRTARLFRFSGLLFFVIIALIWVAILVVWYRSSVTVTEEQAQITLTAPAEFTAGEEIEYLVHYENASRVDWLNTEVVFTEPRGFSFRSSDRELERVGGQLVLALGTLKSKERGEIRIRGQLIGEQNETAVARVDLVLTPENFPGGRFSNQALLATTITALSLDVGIAIPNDAASGERVVATLNVRNLSNQDLMGVYVKLKPAPGSQLLVDDADFTPGFMRTVSEWYIESLPSLETRELRFVFVVAGQPGEQRVIEVESGIQQDDDRFVQRRLNQVVQISAIEVTVQQVYNGTTGPLIVEAGQHVDGVVRYSNVGTVGLKDVIVKVKIEGTGFDSSSLVLPAGAYDSQTRTITWTAATVSELAVVQPQQEGEIPFSFTVLPTEKFPTNAETGKNNVIVSTATVDSPDLPAPPGQVREVISDQAVLSIQTNALLAADAFYDDGRLGITSTGPVPPEVGERTTYTVRLRIGTTLNDVSSVNVRAVLPDGVSFTGEKYVTGGDVSFNDRTGELTWVFVQLPGLTGRAIPPQELHAQVAITPGENVRGRSLDLLNKAEITFTDQFTDEEISLNLTELPSTETASPSRGEVQ